MPSQTKNVKLGVSRVLFKDVDLGYTKGGVEVSVTTETKKVMVDQFGNTEINEYIMGRSCIVTIPLAETTLQNMVNIMPGSTLVEEGGVAATGTITLVALPVDGDTVTINGQVITFKTAATAEFEVTIGGTVADTLNALQVFLAAATEYRLFEFTYTDDDIDELTITAKNKGLAGNIVTLEAAWATPAEVTLSGATLASGAEPTKARIDATNANNQSLLETAGALRLHPIALAESNKNDDFVCPLAATAGALTFAYKIDEERIFNVEFTAYPDVSNGNILFQVGDTTAVAS